MYKEQDRYGLASRAVVFYLSSFIIFFILSFKAYQLQIKTYGDYYSQSEANSIRIVEDNPSRGLIYDKSGNILVDNRPAFSLAVLPTEIADSILAKVTEIAGVDLDQIKKKMKRANPYRPFVIKRQIEDSLMVYFEENMPFFPGITVQIEPKRFYPSPQMLIHALGYIGEVDEATVKSSDLYESGDIVGKSGLEYVYDERLRGEKGYRYIRVDAKGRRVGEISSKTIHPIPASDIHLTVDPQLQEYAEKELSDKRGSIVAINPQNGGILAMVSSPDYSPELFADIITPEVWNKLVNDPDHPLTNKSVQGLYPPGSTYKMISTMLATVEHTVSSNWSIVCNGSFRIGRKTLYCWNHKGHGKVSMIDALKGSCNVYFYNLSLKYSLSQFTKYSLLLKFGNKTGIDITGEKSGLVPSEEYYDRKLGKNKWTKGNVANLAIGQGEMLVTPIQMAQFAMIMANRGTYYTPHFIDYFINLDTGDTSYYQAAKKEVDIPKRAFYNSVQGMREVVKGGTASIVALKEVEIAGKTGTAQNPHGDSHSLFLCFAPFKNPEIALFVLVENAGSGSAVAAPIARGFLEMFYFGNIDVSHRLYQPRPAEDKWLEQIEIVPLQIGD